MTDLASPTRAEIDLGAIRHNARTLLALAGPADVLGVVKANAYGHGAVAVTRALQEEGIGRFAVATHRRLGSRCEKGLPRRSVDGERPRVGP